MNVLVTGGTGTLGRHVVVELRKSGQRARILSRDPHGHVDAVQGDLASGEGLDKAVAGMDAIIHAATSSRDMTKGRAVDVDGTRRLIRAAQRAGVQHFVYVSIVGIDGVAYPYYRTKLAAEAVVRESAVPWTILRATQFHALLDAFLHMFSRVPGLTAIPFGWQFQPVDASEVAHRLTEVVRQQPAGLLPDFGGPEVLDAGGIARSWLAATRSHRRLVNLPLPLKFSRQLADGRLLAPEHRDGTITFGQYLARRYPAA